ncbi:exopolysaccharide biosynthesis polyprenyl glycosylphosphotransferase [uncultured Phascolarctobacterium sp.]|uniref:sugar transferase n=3 Tax=Phascolarctobacterium TaxID=33024 RepID=UPI0027D98F4C|nr:exopolysaccharide biosynthesis polyprenyl glycosylphosphotransferase [uncultured Phascolarctobacterium sp.]
MEYNSLFRKIILIFGDVICLYLATSIAMALELGENQTDKITFHLEFLPILVIMMFFMFNVYGLFSLIRKKLVDIFLNLLVAVTNIYIMAMAMTFFFRQFDYSRLVLIYSAIFSFIFLALWQYICQQWEWKHFPQQTGVLFADGEEAARIKYKLAKTYGLEKTLQATCPGCSNNNWQQLIDANYYVFIGAELPIADKEKVLRYARSTKKQIFFVPTLYELACKNTGFLLVDDIPMQRVSRMLLTAEQRVLKRSLDVIVAGVAIILLSPIMLLTAVLIKLDSKGPAIYSQERVGLYGKKFYVHKFRSMKQYAEANCGPVLAAEGDARITKFGRFMRATRLDELPQLFNVLKGEMSIVGPRPERPFFVEQFIDQKPEYAYRHNVKPGITGLAQIAGKYNTSAYDKLIYDLLYIQDISIKTDLMIMLQTFKVLITKSSTEGVQGK